MALKKGGIGQSAKTCKSIARSKRGRPWWRGKNGNGGAVGKNRAIAHSEYGKFLRLKGGGKWNKPAVGGGSASVKAKRHMQKGEDRGLAAMGRRGD